MLEAAVLIVTLMATFVLGLVILFAAHMAWCFSHPPTLTVLDLHDCLHWGHPANDPGHAPESRHDDQRKAA